MDWRQSLRIALDLAHPFEGYAKRLPDGSCTTYRCPARVLTIGYGSTGPNVTEGMVMSEGQAAALSQAQMEGALTKGVRLAPNLANESSERSGAIADFIYNLGPTAFAASTLRKRILAGDWDAARREILRWNKGGGRVLPGLVARRQAESALLAA